MECKKRTADRLALIGDRAFRRMRRHARRTGVAAAGKHDGRDERHGRCQRRECVAA